ncbi:MAG: PAS domain S-box protein [Flavobacteriales bacterium]|nr:PAS domain S-box protein [Flavobacteriales bacterium]
MNISDLKDKFFNSYYSLVFHQAPYGICVINKQGSFIKSNKVFSKMMGYSADELKDIKFIDITHPDDVEYDKLCMSQFEKKEIKEIRIKKKYIHKKNYEIDVFVGVSPIYVNEVLKYYICIFQDVNKDKMIFDDITASEYQKQQLEELNQELEEFSYIASHDLKSPLRSIATFTNLLESKIAKCENVDEKILYYLDNIKSSITQAENLVTDLLELSRAQKENGNEIEVDLNSFINEIVNDKLKYLEGISDVSISITGSGVIKAPELHISQVFTNIINNAVKYRDLNKDSTIDIKIENYDTKVYVEVSDNGIGIDKKYHQDIFKPFKRLHSNKQYEGSGIGLFTCKKILEKYNGGILIKHSEEGVGTTLSLSWGKDHA